MGDIFKTKKVFTELFTTFNGRPCAEFAQAFSNRAYADFTNITFFEDFVVCYHG